MEIPYDFGEILKALRKESGYTQKRLAESLNLSESQINKYEKNGNMPPFETLKHIAVLFNVSLDKLCGLESRDKLSMYGLTDEQVEILHDLADVFRNQNTSVKKKLSEEQYNILGRITASFLD